MYSLIEFLELCARSRLLIWEYEGPVKIVNFANQNYALVGASGVCPHCGDQSYFRPLMQGFFERRPDNTLDRLCNAAECESCKNFVLVVGERDPRQGAVDYQLKAFYPLGKPNDSVNPAVAEASKEIAGDFAEALRCRWINAYKATVTMCARSLQASAIALGAKGDRLIDQIDSLASQGIITQALKDMAHDIRVSRNVGAHPDKDGLKDVTNEDANDIIAFTRHYFEHVYVMPAAREARRKREADKQSAAPSAPTPSP